MILDSLDNAHRYFSVNPYFQKAFAYIADTDLKNAEPGKVEVDANKLNAIYFSKMGLSAAESILKFECHDKHIDIQVCISGKETIGWKPRGSCLAQKGEYNPEKDVTFYNDVPDTYFNLAAEQFVIFFPEDVHAPMIGDEEIKKLVIKVKI